MSSATKGSLHELGNKLLDRGGLADEFHDREILTRQTIGFYAEVPLSRGEVGMPHELLENRCRHAGGDISSGKRVPELMDMDVRNPQPLAPAAYDVLDVATTDPLVPFRQEQCRVAVLGSVLLDVLTEGLQGYWANHELAALTSLADDFARAEVLDCSIGRLALPRDDAVLVQLAEFGQPETGVNEQQHDRFVANVRDAVNQSGECIVFDCPRRLVVDLGPLHPLDRIGNVAIRIVAEKLVVG